MFLDENIDSFIVHCLSEGFNVGKLLKNSPIFTRFVNFTSVGLDLKPLMIVIFRLQSKDEVVGKDFIKEFGLSHTSMAFPE